MRLKKMMVIVQNKNDANYVRRTKIENTANSMGRREY